MTLQVARLVGGAGTGKTTELQRLMEAALPKLGNDPMRLGFASFTRAARAEAVSRVAAAWDVPARVLEGEGWFRTIHSTCKRCLGVDGKQLLTESKADTEWISEALGVKLSTSLDDEVGRQKFIGDPTVAGSLNVWALSKNSLLPLQEVVRRARLIDDDVPDYDAIVRVAERYESAKRMGDRVDFTDLLMRFAGVSSHPRDGLLRVEPEGELPQVDAWLFDEQQDASPLLDAVCKRLVSAPSVKWCYVVGDPFQAIYGFAGSSADCFLGWPVQKERTMPKSYRCPAPILELGERCLRQMRRGYFNRGIAPADHEGSVTHASSVDEAVALANPTEDWLFVARTNYHATILHSALHTAGKPARWVKSPDGPTKRTDGMSALLALEKDQPITGAEWAKALELIPIIGAGNIKYLERGIKTGWAKKHADSWDVLFSNDLPQVGAQPALVEAIRSGNWCGLVDGGQTWRREAVKWGADVASASKIRVGTIHSVKGAEADNVAYLTTLTTRVRNGMEDDAQHDEECRIAYVAVTRARKNLCIINDGAAGRMVPRMEVA